jgi:hypothetical protein
MILSKIKLVENILTEISDNSTGQISPYDIRHNLLDIIDSVHLLTGSNDLKALNFETPLTRTTRAGQGTIKNLGLDGYFSIDNSAFGYEALKSNYQGVRNTAVGSQALTCNVYGEDNAALGYSALGGNTTGFANIGVGNYSLNSNKSGNFNIAIGHGAGYYADRETSNKLYIASHAVNSEYICDNPTGSGLTPLVYGDLSELKFGVGVASLHDYGTLQIGGDASPSINNSYSLGHEEYNWKQLHLSYSINYPSGVNLSFNGTNGINVSGDLNPSDSYSYNLGGPQNIWNSGYFNNIVVTGVATIHTLNNIQSVNYEGKTIYLASSGCNGQPLVCSYLSDDQLPDAGFIIRSSGVGYLRNYKFTYSPPSQGDAFISSNLPYAKSTWNSNISLYLNSGTYLKTDNIISHNSSGYGLFFSKGNTYISRITAMASDVSSSSGHLAGVGNFNLISNSGVQQNYISTVASMESGVSVSQRFLTGIKKRTKDSLNLFKDKLRGFEFKYIDDSSAYILGANTDRFVLGSYSDTSYFVNTLTMLKDAGQGIIGINNFGSISENIIPKTALDIRSTGNAIIRSTAENQSSTISALQLFGEQSCEYNGFEAAYLNLSGIADLSMYKDSGKQVFFRLYDNNTVGLFTSSGTANAMLTLGDNFRQQAAISFKEYSYTPSVTASYGKIFVRPKIRSNQGNSLYLLDGSGNVHDLVVNKYDTLDARGLYSDASGNTFGGYLCPDRRDDIPTTYNNTAIGHQALTSITNGNNNVVFGFGAGSGLTSGYENILIGNKSAGGLVNSYKNIAIGNSILNSTNGTIHNNIIIGFDNLGSGLNSNYNFMVGASNSSVLLHGTMNDKHLMMPSGGRFSIKDSNNTDSLSFRTNIIEVVDAGGNNYPDNTLSIKFTGNNSADLLLLKHHVAPLNIVPSYASASNNRPHAELKGDLRLLGSVRFYDGTSLSSSSFLTDINLLSSGLSITNSGLNNINNQLSSLTIEGYCPNIIPAPSSPNSPTSGIMIIKNSQWQDIGRQFIINKDPTLVVHSGAYVIAMRVNNEYKPMWVSAKDISCKCCGN